MLITPWLTLLKNRLFWAFRAKSRKARKRRSWDGRNRLGSLAPAEVAIERLEDRTMLTAIGITTVNSDQTYDHAGGTGGLNGVVQNIDIRVEFDSVAFGDGNSFLSLETSAPSDTTTDARAMYISGNGSQFLTFRYTVGLGQNSTDLSVNSINIGATATAGGSSTIIASGANLNFLHEVKIDTDPIVTGVDSTNTDSNAVGGHVYTTGEVLDFQVTFSEPVVVTGIPRLVLDTDGSNTVSPSDGRADFVGGSGTNVLTFQYTIRHNDETTDLDIIGQFGVAGVAAIELNGGSIKDIDLVPHDAESGTLVGGAVDTVLVRPGRNTQQQFQLAQLKELSIDTIQPEINIAPGVSSQVVNGTYGIGEVIPITVSFTESVFVTGVPTLTLATGPVNRVLTLSGGSGTNTLVFNYIVEGTDFNPELDYASTSALQTNGGTIRDAAGLNAILTLQTPGAAGSLSFNKNISIDTIPSVVTVTSSTANGRYKAGEKIIVSLVFNQAVNVTGVPTLQLETGTPDRLATFVSGGGSNTLNFEYTIQAGDVSDDLDYTTTSALLLNGGSIIDISGTTQANPTLPLPGSLASLQANRDLVVDTTPPKVDVSQGADGIRSTSPNNTPDNPRQTGFVIPITVKFTEIVEVTGTPTLVLDTNGIAGSQLLADGPNPDAQAIYTSGSGTDTLTFIYTTAGAHNTPDLDAVSLALLNGATIKDLAGIDIIDLSTPTVDSDDMSKVTVILPGPGRAQVDVITIDEFNASSAYLVRIDGRTFDPRDQGGNPTTATEVRDLLFDLINAARLQADGANTFPVTPTKFIADDGRPGIELTARGDDDGFTTTTGIALAGQKDIVINNSPRVVDIQAPDPNDNRNSTVHTDDSVIDLEVTFSEVVDVAGGPPELVLANGGVAKFVGAGSTPALSTEDWLAQGGSSTDSGNVQNSLVDSRVAGAIETVLAHPTDPNIIYIGTVNGGVWKTVNAQNASPDWTPLTDTALDSLSIGAMTFDLADPSYQTIIVGTANMSNLNAIHGGAGQLYRTVDGGTTWSKLPAANLDDLAGAVTLDGEVISGIVVKGLEIVVTSSGSPDIANGDRGGIFKSNDGGASFNEITLNGAPGGFIPNNNFFDVVFDPTDINQNTLYASVQKEGIYRSVDFGQSWASISGDHDTSTDEQDGGGYPARNNAGLLRRILNAQDNTEDIIDLEISSNGRLYAAVLLDGQPIQIFYTDTRPAVGEPLWDPAGFTWERMDPPREEQGDLWGELLNGNSRPVEGINIAGDGHPLADGRLMITRNQSTDAAGRRPNSGPNFGLDDGHHLQTGDFIVLTGVTGSTSAPQTLNQDGARLNGFYRVTVPFEVNDVLVGSVLATSDTDGILPDDPSTAQVDTINVNINGTWRFTITTSAAAGGDTVSFNYPLLNDAFNVASQLEFDIATNAILIAANIGVARAGTTLTLTGATPPFAASAAELADVAFTTTAGILGSTPDPRNFFLDFTDASVPRNQPNTSGSWTKVVGINPNFRGTSAGGEFGEQGSVHFSMTIDPNNDDILYIGGEKNYANGAIGANFESGAIWRGDASLYSGAARNNPTTAPNTAVTTIAPEWDHITSDRAGAPGVADGAGDPGTANDTAPHAGSRAMTFDAAGNLIEVDDGGIFRRTSSTTSNGDWFSMAGNLSISELRDVAYDSVSKTLFGGTQNNGTITQQFEGDQLWTEMTPPSIPGTVHGGDVAVDTRTNADNNESIRYALETYYTRNPASPNGDPSDNLQVRLTRTSFDSSGTQVGAVSVLNVPGVELEDSPFVLNAVDPTRMLFGANNGIYHSLNADQGADFGFIDGVLVNDPVVSGDLSGTPIAYGSTNGDTLESISVAGVGVRQIDEITIQSGGTSVVRIGALTYEVSGGTANEVTRALFDAIDADTVFTGIAVVDPGVGNVLRVFQQNLNQLFNAIVGDREVVYVGDRTGNMYSGSVMSLGAPVDLEAGANDPVLDVRIDPRNSHRAFAIDHNSVFMTLDKGQSWLDVTDNLLTKTFQQDPTRLHSLEFITGDVDDAIVIGTDKGAYFTLTTPLIPTLLLPTPAPVWTEVGANLLPNVAVVALDFNVEDRVLVASTLGRGAYLINADTVITSPSVLQYQYTVVLGDTLANTQVAGGLNPQKDEVTIVAGGTSRVTIGEYRFESIGSSAAEVATALFNAINLRTVETNVIATDPAGTNVVELVGTLAGVSYVVTASDAGTNDLRVVSNDALDLQGATIQDRTLNYSSLPPNDIQPDALPTPGGFGTLSFNNDIAIDDTNVDQPPINIIPQSTATTDEITDLRFQNLLPPGETDTLAQPIQIFDVEAARLGTTLGLVTISSSQAGTSLRLAAPPSGTIYSGAGQTITLTDGTLNEINNALVNGLIFTPTSPADVTLTITIEDANSTPIAVDSQTNLTQVDTFTIPSRGKFRVEVDLNPGGAPNVQTFEVISAVSAEDAAAQLFDLISIDPVMILADVEVFIGGLLGPGELQLEGPGPLAFDYTTTVTDLQATIDTISVTVTDVNDAPSFPPALTVSSSTVDNIQTDSLTISGGGTFRVIIDGVPFQANALDAVANAHNLETAINAQSLTTKVSAVAGGAGLLTLTGELNEVFTTIADPGDTLTGASEDVLFTITHAALTAAYEPTDPDTGAVIDFRVESVTQGSLTKNGQAVIPGVTVINATETLVWTPPLNANGNQAAFTIVAYDGQLASATAREVTINLTAVNDAPELNQVATFTGALEDVDFDITYAELLDKSDAFDFDSGDVVSFRVELVDSGLLRKIQPPITVLSSTIANIQTDLLTITGGGTFRVTIGGARFQVNGVDADAVASALATAINAQSGTTKVSGGAVGAVLTLTGELNEVYTTTAAELTPMNPGSDTLGVGETVSWVADSNASGSKQAFRVMAIDTSFATSGTPIQVNVIVDPANDAPTLTSIAILSGAPEDTPFPISYSTLLGLSDAFDIEGDPLRFRIESVSSGVLQKNNLDIVFGSTLVANGETVVWTPGSNQSGVLDAFTIRVFDGVLNSELPAVLVQVNVIADNDRPEITGMATLLGVKPGQTTTITHAMLHAAAQGLNDPDLPLDAIGFQITDKVTGTLLPGIFPITVVPGGSFQWTAPTGVKGETSAFKVVAYDGAKQSLQEVLAKVIVVDVAPMLDGIPAGSDAFSPFLGATEDQDFTITYASLVAAAGDNLFEPNGDEITFLVQSINTGTLKQNGIDAVPGTTELTSSSDPFVWKPLTNDASSSATDHKTAFHVVAVAAGLRSAISEPVKINVTPVNDAPTLTVVTPLDEVTNHGTLTISHQDLINAGDEFDQDGDVLSFRVTGVVSGSLTQFNGTNDVSVLPGTTLLTSSSSPLIWTPAVGAGPGATFAFTIRVFDGATDSATDVQVQVNVVAGSVPTLTQINTLTGAMEDTFFDITYAMLALAANEADSDQGDTLSFRIESVDGAKGTLTKGGLAVVPGTTLLSMTETIRWTPKADTNGVITNAFQVVAYDGAEMSTSLEGVDINVAAANDPPTLTMIDTLLAVEATQTLTITYAQLAAAADEFDIDGDPIDFRITGETIPGSLSVVLGTRIGVGGTVQWTAPAGVKGIFPAFKVEAFDGTDASTSPVQVNVSVVDTAPTLTAINPLSGATEDIPFDITYDTLLVASTVADVNGDAIGFQIQEINNGTLTITKFGFAPVAAVSGVSVLEAGDKLTWIPAADANGTLGAFKVVAKADGLLSSLAQQVQVNVTASNDTPTLTVVTPLDEVTNHGTLTITYQDLINAGNEFDLDGDVLSFRVTGVVSGSLTQFNGTNDVSVLPGTTLLNSSSSPLIWTPAVGAGPGATFAFSIRVFDGATDSATDVTVQVNVVNNTVPTLTTIDTLSGTEDTPLTITYAALLAASDLADINAGDDLRFRIETVSSGTLMKDTISVIGGTTTLGLGESIVWTAGRDLNGQLDAFTVVGFDGLDSSTPAVQVKVNVAAVNDVPTLTTIDTIGSIAVGQTLDITYIMLAGAANEADIDGDQIDFRITQVTTGTLTIGGLPVVPGTTRIRVGDTVQWTAPAGVQGTTPAFKVEAFDGTAASAPAVQVNVTVVETAPTLTTITPLDGAREDTPFTILYNTLLAASNANDANGDPLTFRIEELNSGSLLKVASTVLTVEDTQVAGTTMPQIDDVTIPSGGKTRVTVADFVFEASGATADDIAADLVTKINGAILPTLITASSTGANLTLTADNNNDPFTTTATQLQEPAIAGTATLDPGERLIWTPVANANGAQAAFRVVVSDGTLFSSMLVPVTINVLEVADAPTLDTIDPLNAATPNGSLTITNQFLLDASNAFDADGDPLSFRVTFVDAAKGSLTQGGASVLPGTTLLQPAVPPMTVVTTTPSGTTTRQVDTVTVLVPQAGSIFDLSINGKVFSYTATNLDTDATVAAQLSSLVNSNGVPFTATSVGSVITLTADVVNTPFMSVALGSITPPLIWTPATSTLGLIADAFSVTAFDGATNSTPAVGVSINVVDNTPPTLTKIDFLPGATEDRVFTIDYATLRNASDISDINLGDELFFRIEVVDPASGTLFKGGLPVVGGTTILGAGESLLWNPTTDLNGNVDAFTVVAFDGLDPSTLAKQVTINVAQLNDAPTLTTITTVVAGVPGKPVTITHQMIATNANEFDADGDPVGFRITEVTTGTLTRALVAAPLNLVRTQTATATLTQIDTATVLGRPVGTVYRVTIDGVDFATTSAGGDTTATIAARLRSQINSANIGVVVTGGAAMRITGLTVGIAFSTQVAGEEPALPNTTVIRIGESIIWTPPSGTGTSVAIPAFKVLADDGQATDNLSSPPILVSVRPINVAPTLTRIDTLTGVAENSSMTITFDRLMDASDAVDANGDSISFQIQEVNVGTLTITSGGAVHDVVVGVTEFAPNDTVKWTPPVNVNGLQPAFKVVATDGTLVSPVAVQVEINVTAVNNVPTLTTVDPILNPNYPGSVSISHEELLARSNAFDADGDSLIFRVESVTSGTLTIGGTPVLPGTTLLEPGTVPITQETTTTAAANRRQIDTVTILPPRAGAIYSIDINGTVYSVTATRSDTDATIAAQLRSLVNADGPLPVSATGTGNIIILSADANNTPFSTFVSGSTAQSLVWTPAGGTNPGVLTPAFTVTAVDGSSSSSPPVQVSVNSFNADLSDVWFINNLAGEIIQNGSQLTFIDGNGNLSIGRFISVNQIIRTDTGAVGTIQGNFILWNNGEAWERAIDITGLWEINGLPTSIQRVGTTLIFTNESGVTSQGVFLNSQQLMATGWGNLVAEFTANEIRWRNGSVWVRPSIQLSLAGFYNFNNLTTEVRQNGNDLEFFNESGNRSAGRVLNATQVVATDWNIIGTIVNGAIHWSNDSVWNQGTGQQAIPDISGGYNINGENTEVRQNGALLTFINESGDSASGRFTSFGNGVFGLIATQWGNLTGTFENNQITWSNGTAWVKNGTPQPPALAGSWGIDGSTTRIEQLGNNLVFINENGQRSSGYFVSPNRVFATEWNLGGFIENNRILWANNTVWNKG